jgi:hypothetical protein
VAVLADLAEPLGPDATTEIGVTAYETVRAVAAWAASSGTATIDLFARRGSWRELPLVAVDPDELGPVPDDPLAWFAVQEAVYGRLWSSGMLTGLLPRLLPGGALRRVAVAEVTAAALEIPAVATCVDLSRFIPADVEGRHLVWDRSGGEAGAAVARAADSAPEETSESLAKPSPMLRAWPVPPLLSVA